MSEQTRGERIDAALDAFDGWYDSFGTSVYSHEEARRKAIAAALAAADRAAPQCHEWAFDDTIQRRYCVNCGVEDSDPSTAIRFATCAGAAPPAPPDAFVDAPKLVIPGQCDQHGETLLRDGDVWKCRGCGMAVVVEGVGGRVFSRLKLTAKPEERS